MIRNGLYHITVEMLDDGIQGGNQGVMVVRDGTLRGRDYVLLRVRDLHAQRTASGRAR